MLTRKTTKILSDLIGLVTGNGLNDTKERLLNMMNVTPEAFDRAVQELNTQHVQGMIRSQAQLKEELTLLLGITNKATISDDTIRATVEQVLKEFHAGCYGDPGYQPNPHT